MTLDATTYFGHLRAYVNDRYVMHDGVGGEVILREKYFPPTGTRAKTRKVRYYHFDEVQGQSLIDLENTSVQEI